MAAAATTAAVLAAAAVVGVPSWAAADNRDAVGVNLLPLLPTNVDSKALPLLTRPTLSNPTTVSLSAQTPVLQLDSRKDYVVQVPAGTVFTSGAAISGGRRVVLENATLQYAPPPGADPEWLARGLFLREQAEIMFVDNVQIRGPLNEGIQLDQKSLGVAVVLKRISIDPVSGSYEGHHADLLQTWAGPSRLVVDDFEGVSNYQGMFLRPNQLWQYGPRPEYFWLRNVRLDVSTGAYALWTDGYGAFPLQTTDVVVKPHTANRDAWLWPKPSTGDKTWRDVVAVFD